MTSQGGVLGNVRRYWQASFVVNRADVVIDPRTYTGYLLQHACLRGMCGAPVFDASGKVRGMAAATLTRAAVDDSDNPTPLRNGVVLDVEQIRTFIEEYADLADMQATSIASKTPTTRGADGDRRLTLGPCLLPKDRV